MTPEQEERLVCAFETVAGCLSSISRTLEIQLEKTFPPKKPAEPVTITYLKSDEERMREEQGDTGEATLADWLTIGPRERRFLEEIDRINNQKTRDR